MMGNIYLKMSADAARKMIRKSGEGAELQFPVHPIYSGTVVDTIGWLRG
jgi:hypothetical protein